MGQDRLMHMKVFEATPVTAASIARTISFDGTDLPADCTEFCIQAIGVWHLGTSGSLSDIKITQANTSTNPRPGSCNPGGASSSKLLFYGEEGVPLKRTDGAITVTYTSTGSFAHAMWIKGYWR